MNGPATLATPRATAQEGLAPMQDADYAPRIVARFWMKVRHRENGCWEWTASKRNGYGQFGVREGHIPPAHRYAYEYLVGPIPEGMVIDHLCRNPACVNPAHLEPVTSVENVMRGVSPRAVNARKGFCDSGHSFDEANTYVDPRGRRQCRACRRAATIAYNQKNPAHWREYRAKRKAEGNPIRRKAS
jgi:hypothetical protein